MSRYEVEGRSPGTRVAVGWDPPMMTFFVLVYDDGAKREGPTVWLGAKPRELPGIQDLKRAVGPHAALSAALERELFRDCDEGRA